MAEQTPLVAGTAIVLRGAFNPAIFQPAWFAVEKLLPGEEAESAKVEIVTSQITSFTTAWLTIQVTNDRFMAHTQLANMELPLRDLVLATFRLLRHTPISVMGLNRDAHYEMGSAEAWHRIGNLLAPKERWEGLLNQPGTRSLTIEGTRPDKYEGYIRVKLEPSNVIPLGLFIEINDHFQFATPPSSPGDPWKSDTESLISSANMLAALEGAWDESFKRARSLMEGVLKF